MRKSHYSPNVTKSHIVLFMIGLRMLKYKIRNIDCQCIKLHSDSFTIVYDNY